MSKEAPKQEKIKKTSKQARTKTNLQVSEVANEEENKLASIWEERQEAKVEKWVQQHPNIETIEKSKQAMTHKQTRKEISK